MALSSARASPSSAPPISACPPRSFPSSIFSVCPPFAFPLAFYRGKEQPVEPENLSLAQLRHIVFEGVTLPRSMMAVSLLAVLAAKTDRELAVWLASFPDCRGNARSAPSLSCFVLAGRARDLMLDQRNEVIARI